MRPERIILENEPQITLTGGTEMPFACEKTTLSPMIYFSLIWVFQTGDAAQKGGLPTARRA
jgi:hypothetical protein